MSQLRAPHTEDMTLEDCHEFFRQCRELGWYPAVLLIGGEPTRHAQFEEICRISRDFADEGVRRGLCVKPELAGLVQLWSNQTTQYARDMCNLVRLKFNVSVVGDPAGVPTGGTTKEKGSMVLSIYDIYVSPLDFGLPVRQPCWQHASICCGISVDHEGYTPCATGGAVDGMLKIGFRTKCLADLFDPEIVGEITNLMCAHCGNDLTKLGLPEAGVSAEEWQRLVKSCEKWRGHFVSPTWKKVFEGREVGPS